MICLICEQIQNGKAMSKFCILTVDSSATNRSQAHDSRHVGQLTKVITVYPEVVTETSYKDLLIQRRWSSPNVMLTKRYSKKINDIKIHDRKRIHKRYTKSHALFICWMWFLKVLYKDEIPSCFPTTPLLETYMPFESVTLRHHK